MATKARRASPWGMLMSIWIVALLQVMVLFGGACSLVWIGLLTTGIKQSLLGEPTWSDTSFGQ